MKKTSPGELATESQLKLMEQLRWDNRLTTHYLRQGAITESDIARYLQGLPDETEFDWTVIEEDAKEEALNSDPSAS